MNGRSAQRRVARFASLHPTAIGQKVEVVIEHFRRHVMAELDGHARAMIVTGGREHALRYFFGVRDHIEANGYTDVKALVSSIRAHDFLVISTVFKSCAEFSHGLGCEGFGRVFR